MRDKQLEGALGVIKERLKAHLADTEEALSAINQLLREHDGRPPPMAVKSGSGRFCEDHGLNYRAEECPICEKIDSWGPR